ncbi:MAG: glutamine amidotransferase [bacterium]
MPKIIFSPQIPVLIILFLVFIAVAVTFYTYKRVTGRPELILVSLRLTAILVILFVLFQPLISITGQKKEKSNIIFLIDNSASMGILDKNGKDRLSRLKELFKEKNILNDLSKKNNVHYYSFSGKLKKMNINDIGALKAGETKTDFFAVLSEVDKDFRKESIAGIFILSDGIDNHPENKFNLPGDLPYPVFTISPGEEKTLRDININLNNVPEKAFLDKKTAVNFTIELSGFGAKNVYCVLREDGTEIKKEKFKVLPGKNTLSLEFTPKNTGPHHYLLYIPNEINEATPENNEEEFYMNVIKDKLYILVLGGAPSPEYKFLHKYVSREPNIKSRFLVSKNKNGDFFKLEENEGNDYFPVKKEDLFEYDLIIFNDIERKKIPETLISWIKEFTGGRGGGVLMLGGKNSFHEGGYSGSAVEDILPVVFKKEGPLLSESKFSFELTNDGKTHPAAQLIPDSLKNTQVWKELPVLEGYNIINKGKPGALILAVASPDKNNIVWAAQSYGRGRTMAVMANDLWRWDFLMTGIGKTSEYYERFWSRVISWLTSVKGDVFDVETDKLVYSSGETANLMASLYQKELTSFKINGFVKEKKERNREVKDIIVFSSYSGSKDLLKAEYKPPVPGEYDITVEAFGGKGFIGRVIKKIFVKKDRAEWQNIKIDEKFLKEISDRSHGKFYKAEELIPFEFKKFEGDIKNKILKTKVSYDLSLWDNVFVFSLFVILLASEWYLRKRRGLK